MTDLLLIGIGTGNPDHLTTEARRAIAEADLILLPEKGAGKSDLADLRRQIIAEVTDCPPPIATFEMPERDPELPYLQRVEAWHDMIADRWTTCLAEYAEARRVALLVWGDPSLYDSTLRIAARLSPRPKIRVIPGITSLQALTAAHVIPLNTLGGPVTVTTGRRLRDQGWPKGAETIVVMLDGGCAFQTLDPSDLWIWWGAYLGMEEQILCAGPLAEVGEDIIDRRAAARAAHGWIMDTYLLRRGTSGLD
ncbi:precorrin-6A synthase (deacetylating) [Thalassococcus sp. S3]|uniref:precorrin-6A synthase (deacetylating) n=1 Tax=Thalassococcus sp. S3 TaxID=2017482 RepID=UPI00102432ED|nr:precorrin-6A synthase (deacetylating) [Thalassococcus sp. S3]QBF30346.1 precorrin-6A synthase (deacetylating) [Thalassococcus sp. S3]